MHKLINFYVPNFKEIFLGIVEAIAVDNLSFPKKRLFKR